MFDSTHVGRRVEYTARSGKKQLGTIRGIADGTNFVDVDIDGAMREKNYIPFDMLRLLHEDTS